MNLRPASTVLAALAALTSCSLGNLPAKPDGGTDTSAGAGTGGATSGTGGRVGGGTTGSGGSPAGTGGAGASAPDGTGGIASGTGGGPTGPGGATTGSGGAGAGMGGATAGTGGSPAGPGGATAGTGGTMPGTGGATAGTGGGPTGTGGATPGTGGTMPGTGGMAPGTGGAASGTGGTTPGTGGTAPGTGGAVPGTGGMAPGTGGAALGTGGGGGAGGETQLGCTSPLIIDDMEDGNNGVCSSDGRRGAWYVVLGTFGYPSGTAVTTPAANEIFDAYKFTTDGRTGAGSQYGISFSGAGLNSDAMPGIDWAILGASVADNGPYDASKHRGMTFWVRSVGGSFKLRVNFSTTAVRGAENQGTCVATATKNCNDSYGAWADVGNTWRQFAFDFSYLHQMGWGVPIANPDLAHLRTIEFEYYIQPYDTTLSATIVNPPNFNMLIDDLQFYD